MKKLILLLFIPLVFTCSSDDEDNNSNETFLEKYDGVVWESIITEVMRLSFHNSQSFQTYYNSNGVDIDENNNVDYCYNLGEFSDEITFTFNTNLEDNFEFTATYPEGDSYTVFIVVTNGGNTLEYTSDDNEPIYFARTDLNEIPCD